MTTSNLFKRLQVANASGLTPLHFAARARSVMSVRLLCQLGADVNQMDKSGKTPLVYATESAALDVLETLLQFGALPCANDCTGKTPLHWVAGLKASNLNLLKIAEHLINMTNNLDQRDNDGCTPLHHAAVANNTDVSTTLV